MRLIALTLIGSAMSFCAATVHAAFIVEADSVAPAGKAFDHFTSTGHGTSSTPSTAVGLSGNQSAFGSSSATTPDVYTIRYRPGDGSGGTDADNTVYAAGTSLGNSSATDADGLGPTAPAYSIANLAATGLTGGISGLYNVYVTVPGSTNVDASGSNFVIQSDLGNISLNPVVMNNGGTGPDEVAGGSYTGGLNNRWLHLGSVALTAGTQYTMVISSNSSASTSQRFHGAMWEFVQSLNAPPVVDPEPAESNPNTMQGDIISTLFTATDATALPVTFSNAVLNSFVPLIPGATNPTFNGVVDSAGNFTWDTTGFARGVYTINVTATDSGSPPLSGTGGGYQVTIEEVPEPTTLALCGLAMVGALGLVRRRDA